MSATTGKTKNVLLITMNVETGLWHHNACGGKIVRIIHDGNPRILCKRCNMLVVGGSVTFELVEASRIDVIIN